MQFCCFLMLIIPIVVYSIDEEDVNYVRHLLKEYNERVLGRNENQLEEKKEKMLTAADTAPGATLMKALLNTETSDNTSISDVNRQSELADALFEGDIMLTRSQADILLQPTETRSKRQAGIPGVSINLWDRTIAYSYDEAYPEGYKKYTKYAMDIYGKSTCLKFKAHSNEKYRLYFALGDSCWSSIGRRENRQTISLSHGCQTIGHTIHEIGHALGFYHGQTRWDRDDYITVNTKNIREKYIPQFEKINQYYNDNLGLPYDYGSVMHYDQFDSHNDRGFVTMNAHNKLYQWTMGSYYESFYDLLMLNILYKCNETCAKSTTKCENGGYPNPNNCDQCNCPRGYGGKLCNERPKGCGKILAATSEWQQFSDVLGKETQEMAFDECYYWIQAPEGATLEINLVKYKGGNCHGGCVYGGIEIAAQQDTRQTGYRFCCDEPQFITSNHSLVPIIAYNRYLRHNATLSYRYIMKESDTTTKLPVTEATTQQTTPPSTTQSTVPTVMTTTTLPNTSENVRYCFDRHLSCQEQKELGFCTESGVGEWYSDEERKYWCQLTCNLCEWQK